MMQGFAIYHDCHTASHVSHVQQVLPELVALSQAKRWLMWVGSLHVLHSLDMTRLSLEQCRLLVLHGVNDALRLQIADAALQAGINGAVFVEHTELDKTQVAWGLLFHPSQTAAQQFLYNCLQQGYRFSVWRKLTTQY